MLPVPLTPEFFMSMDGKLLRRYPNVNRQTLGHVLPYLYRKDALDRPLEKFELGRAIYHLAQRRGYLSNRRQELKNEQESGVVKAGIDSLKEEMISAGARTLGEYFCGLDSEKTRIRSRYTAREMYVDEFRKICAAQRATISPELETRLYKTIFFQLPLKSCKKLVGACSLYPDERRCSYAREEAQLFRIYSTLNHLRVESSGRIRELDGEERARALKVLNGFSDHLTRRGTITLQKLAKAVKLGKRERFTLSDEQKEIYGNEIHAALYHVFGDRAVKLAPEERDQFFNDLKSIEKIEILKRRLSEHWMLDDAGVAEALKIAVPDEYCAYSLKALRELLPDLESGIPLATIRKLEHPTGIGREMDQLPLLDDAGIDLRNPVVRRTLTELRIVVNAIISRYGKPDRIRVELARDLKSTNRERERRVIELRKREKERAAIAEKIVREAGISRPSRNDILKVMLAEECGYECPYTGKCFSMAELLSGKDIQIEHIIPFSRSFDDSFRNKTLCVSAVNARKGNRTPFEAFSGTEYAEMLQRVAHFQGAFAESKLELFKLEEVDSQEFLARNLNDTRYASKLAMRYLGLLYGGVTDKDGKQRIFATSGGCTAMIRRAWGGNYLLGEGEKIRSDHRHHAIDALTIALTTPDMVREIAELPPEQRFGHTDVAKSELKKRILDTPLFRQASRMLESMPVSHHVVNKIRGAFHKETIYGKDRGNAVRHKRVRLEDLSADNIGNIVDPVIKALLLKRLGVADGEEKTLSAREFKARLNVGEPLIYRDRNGAPVNVVKAVRVAATVNAVKIGSGDGVRFVANGSNYLLAIFAVLDASGAETAWEGEVVTLLEARTRLLAHQPLFDRQRPGRRFKFTLKKGDVVTIEKDGETMLCVIRGVSLPQFYCVPIQEARMKKEIQVAKLWFTPTVSAAFKWKMKKYRMNIFGELRRSND